MRPFLLLATRVDDSIADGEYEAVCRLAGLEESRLHRLRVEQGPIGEVDLDRYAGVLAGGSPFNSSDPAEAKSALQRRVEADLSGLMDRVVERDMPFLGMCYGVGTLGTHQGGLVDRTHGEITRAATITLTEEGRRDPLTEGIPDSFQAFVGHKEAVTRLPSHAVLLASGDQCPVQMFRIKQNMYATQFHPELDADGMCVRMTHYRYEGYFDPEEFDDLITMARTTPVPHAATVLRNFVRRYGGLD